jgi:preprotein translocase subunit SecG
MKLLNKLSKAITKAVLILAPLYFLINIILTILNN